MPYFTSTWLTHFAEIKDLLKIYIKNLLLGIPHISPSATSLQDCCKLSDSLYTETAPWLQTPPLKLMSAAKFSLLQIYINPIPATKSPCFAPGMSLMCFTRTTSGVSHSLPHQGHVYSQEEVKKCLRNHF